MKIDHLTSFALLLSGNDEGGSSSSNGDKYVLAWVSLGLVAFAILMVILAVFSSELWFRHRRLESAKNFRRISSAIASAEKVN